MQSIGDDNIVFIDCENMVHMCRHYNHWFTLKRCWQMQYKWFAEDMKAAILNIKMVTSQSVGNCTNWNLWPCKKHPTEDEKYNVYNLL